jgi:uncharacterized protein involved in tellurium resistance
MNKIVDGILVLMTDEEVAARNAEVAAAKAEETANDYKVKRAAEYPPIEDQLDEIYHNGIEAWKATIKVVKDKYPKP